MIGNNTNKVFRGFGVSVAASPTSSVPAKLKAAVTKTVQTPCKHETHQQRLL
jgi:hypothetical protein